MYMTLTGAQQLEQVLLRAPARAQQALGMALYREAQKTMALSKRDYVPVDMGVLRGSGTVKPPKRIGVMGVEIVMGYGGAAKAYAVVQHENLSLSHPPKRPRRRTGTRSSRRPGTARYLAIPMKERELGMEERLAFACDVIFTKAGL